MGSVAPTVIAVALAACGGGGKATPVEPAAKPPDRIVVTETVVEALAPIQFTTAGAIAPTSFETLDAVAGTLTANPGIASCEVQVRIPADGADRVARVAVAQKRAELIVAYLVTRQVAADRLVAQGYPEPPPSPQASHAAFVITRRSNGPDRAALEKRIEALEAELAQREQIASEIVIALDGTVLTVEAAKPGDVRGIDDKTALVASKAFIDVVTGSRAAIQACYHKALVANTALASKTISLAITASFTSGGAHQRSATSPSLGTTFDDCMKTVMTAWSLPGATSAMTFKAQVVLKP